MIWCNLLYRFGQQGVRRQRKTIGDGDRGRRVRVARCQTEHKPLDPQQAQRVCPHSIDPRHSFGSGLLLWRVCPSLVQRTTEPDKQIGTTFTIKWPILMAAFYGDYRTEYWACLVWTLIEALCLMVVFLGFTMPLVKGRGIFNYDFGLLPFREPVFTVVSVILVTVP